MVFVSCQIREADTEEELQATFHIDEAADLLYATGYRKAITKITVADKSSIRSALLDYHLLLKCKAETDSFIAGLGSLGVAGAIRAHPELMKPLFVDDGSALTAGLFHYFDNAL